MRQVAGTRIRAAALGLVLGALTVVLSPSAARADAAAKRAAEAAAWAAANPEACALLDDDSLRGRMDGLLRKLATLCDRPDLVGGVAQEENEPAPDALGTDVRANDPSGDSGASRTQSETSVAVNETTGTLCTGYNDSFHGVTQGQGYTGWSRSTDGGVTWTDRGALGPTSFGDPALVWRKLDGKFYFAALSSAGLGLWRSDDDCQNFVFVATIASGSDDKELMAVDNNPASPFYGRLYVAWTDFGSGARIYSTFSTNAGATWSTQLALSASGVDVQGAWPAVAPNGDVYVAWLRWNPWPSGPMDIEVARSTNGGVSYALVANPMTGGGNPQDATATGNCGRPALKGNIRYLPSPQIAVGPDGALHVIYAKDPDGAGGDVVNSYYRRSTNNGASWGTEVQLNDVGTNDQFFATLSVGATNVVSTSWYDRRQDAANLRARYYGRTSFNGGVTWGPNVEITDTDSPIVLDPNLATCYHGDYDTQIQTPSAAVIVWSDDRGTEGGGNNPDVWTDTVPLSTDFLVIATPAAQTICAGSNATVDLSVPSFNGFTNPVTLSVTGNPAGTSAGFSVNPVTPPGASVLTIGNTAAVPGGSYPMTISGISGAITHSTDSTLEVVAGAPAAPTLVSPPDGASGVSTVPTLTWTASPGAASYLVQVDDNADFSSPVYSATVAGASAVASGLSPDLTYYWRVRADNICGNATSTVFDFRTGPIACSTPALAIPDGNPAGVNDDQVLAIVGPIADLDVSLDVSHTWVGDLVFTLTHVDTGTSVTFFDRPGRTTTGFGCDGDDVDVIANDEGPDGSIESQCANLPAIFGDRVGGDPANASLFAAFDGEDLAGTWRLNASDHATPDPGTLNEWCLLPTREGPGLSLSKTVGTVPATCAATDAITVTTGTTVYYCFHVENTGVVALNFHDLVDDHLGTLLDNAPISLPPGATYDHIVPDVATATVTNTATWTGADSAGGFAVDDTIPLDFEDISGTGTAVPLSDDSVSPPLPMNFTFNFFGTDYTDAYISSNGFVTLLAGQPNGCCTGAPIPTAAAPNGLIAGWWEDLNPGAGGTVHYQTLGSAPNRRFIAQFENVPHFGGGNLVTLQFKLFEGTNVVEVHYQAAPSDGGTHSAGVENETGTVGVQYFLGSTGLTTPLAVRYTPATPVTASATDSATVTIADPNIVVSPPDLASVQAPDTQVTLPLDIQNTGVADLDWTIDEAAAPADAPRGTGTFLNQAPNQVNGLFADSTCERCGTGQQSIAENFTLAAPATIGQITFWGGYFNTDTPLATDVLRVLVHADASGLPGAVVYDESNVASTRVQTGVILFGVHEWEFTLTLAAPVNLTPGTYWVEIFNNTAGNPDDFFWETGNLDPTHGLAGSGWTTATPGVAWNFDGATDMAIQIDGPASPCYTPSDLPWLSVNPTAGTTLAGQTSTVDVTFDSTGLAPGSYDGLLCVSSNDPDTPLVEVPVALTVAGDTMPFFGDFETGNTSQWSLAVP
ncbi:MAG: hypothetical protein F9K16_10260 [Thermoanaerobaculia bacterium]|nr:MAG: hypothetical protein F9K16_10260 [Thermoanaerobaculia bacterium]